MALGLRKRAPPKGAFEGAAEAEADAKGGDGARGGFSHAKRPRAERAPEGAAEPAEGAVRVSHKKREPHEAKEEARLRGLTPKLRAKEEAAAAAAAAAAEEEAARRRSHKKGTGDAAAAARARLAEAEQPKRKRAAPPKRKRPEAEGGGGGGGGGADGGGGDGEAEGGGGEGGSEGGGGEGEAEGGGGEGESDGGGDDGGRTTWTESPEDAAPVSPVSSVIGSAAARRRLPEGTAMAATS